MFSNSMAASLGVSVLPVGPPFGLAGATALSFEAALGQCAFLFVQTTPNPVVDADAQCPGQTLVAHPAAATDALGLVHLQVC